MKRLLTIWLACSATNLAVGVIFHRFVIGDRIQSFYAQLGSEPRPDLALGTHLVIATVLVYLFSRTRSNGSTILDGYKIGAAVGVLAISPIVFVFLVMGVETSTIVMDALWHIVIEEPLTGVVAAVMYRATDSTHDGRQP